MRIKIEKPERYHFSTQMKVRVSDINYGNHMSNDKFLTFANQVRVEFYAAYNMHELDLLGTGSIMSDAFVNYLSEGKLNDILIIYLSVENIHRLGFDLYYRFKNESTGKDVAMVRTCMLCYDYEQHKIAKIPSTLTGLFSSIESISH